MSLRFVAGAETSQKYSESVEDDDRQDDANCQSGIVDSGWGVADPLAPGPGERGGATLAYEVFHRSNLLRIEHNSYNL